MNSQPAGDLLVSIVINNHNYAAYLKPALESALEQTWPQTEVIVVDDGSTDASRQILRRYKPRVSVLLKEKGGQTSCFNVGFTQSRGDLVIFLDADDLLDSTVVARAVEAFRQGGVAHVHWPLRDINGTGKPTGARRPAASLASGNLQPVVMRDGPNSYERVPTSGNAWSRAFLNTVIPLPEPERELGVGSAAADAYLSALAPLYGRTAALDEPGGCYRVHGANGYAAMQARRRLERDLKLWEIRATALAEHAAHKGLVVNIAAWRRRSSWAHRLHAAQQAIEQHVPSGERYTLLDEGRLAVDVLDRPAIAFPEQEGRYWGIPTDGEAAAAELERQEQTYGTRFVVVLWPAFWWIEHYQPLHNRLKERYTLLFEDDLAHIWQRRQGAGLGARS